MASAIISSESLSTGGCQSFLSADFVGGVGGARWVGKKAKWSPKKTPVRVVRGLSLDGSVALVDFVGGTRPPLDGVVALVDFVWSCLDAGNLLLVKFRQRVFVGGSWPSLDVVASAEFLCVGTWLFRHSQPRSDGG